MTTMPRCVRKQRLRSVGQPFVGMARMDDSPLGGCEQETDVRDDLSRPTQSQALLASRGRRIET